MKVSSLIYMYTLLILVGLSVNSMTEKLDHFIGYILVIKLIKVWEPLVSGQMICKLELADVFSEFLSVIFWGIQEDRKGTLILETS